MASVWVKPKLHFEEIQQNYNDCVGIMQTFFFFSFPKSLKLELGYDATRKEISVRQTFNAWKRGLPQNNMTFLPAFFVACGVVSLRRSTFLISASLLSETLRFCSKLLRLLLYLHNDVGYVTLRWLAEWINMWHWLPVSALLVSIYVKRIAPLLTIYLACSILGTVTSDVKMIFFFFDEKGCSSVSRSVFVQ